MENCDNTFSALTFSVIAFRDMILKKATFCDMASQDMSSH